MKSGIPFAVALGAATLALVAAGTIWPSKTALVYAGGGDIVSNPSTPEAAVRSLGDQIKIRAWQKAYDSLANKAEFTEQQFQHDLYGYYPNLRSYATLDKFEVFPLHASDNDAEVQMKLYWATVVGTSVTTRNLHLTRTGSRWQVEWPYTKQPSVPPQVIPVNYLRWDVIYPSSGDDWGVGGVEEPHVKIVDMHPLQRAEGLVLMGELLNEDVVPAYVSITATVNSKDHKPLATETSFDKISHLLLPKQVTPFFIQFHNVSLSDVGSVDMHPFSTLISASADPVIEIQNAKLNPAPGATLTGELVNESGQIANVAHVLGTFYDKSGQLVWVADDYVDSALLPQTPVAFTVHIPEDLARKVSSERTIVASYSEGGTR